MLRIWVAALRYEILAFVVLGGWVLSRRPPRPWRTRCLALSVVLYATVLAFLVWGEGYLSRRHALAIGLPLLGTAAVGWKWFVSVIGARWRRRAPGVESASPGQLSPAAICAALVVVLILVWGPRDLRARRLDRSALRQAAEWLAEAEQGRGPVAAQKLRTAYYAGAPYVPLLSGRDGHLRRDLRRGGAEWVVIDEARVGDHLGLAEGIGDWLEPVHRAEAEGRAALVLEIRQEPAG